MKYTTIIFLAIAILFTHQMNAQPTTFAYQGFLSTSGTPANGNYDFEFALFDTLGGANQIGTTLARSNLVVANGVFSVNLDFGSQFSGANRFLEIRVRPSGAGAFTALTPRQSVTSSPYSIKSLNSDNATSASTATNADQLGGVAANQYVLTGDARLSDARSPLPGSASYIQNQNTGPQAASNFNISGNGTADILNAVTRLNIAGVHALSNPGTNNLFAGAGSGQSNSSGINNAFFGANAGPINSTGTDNAFFGRQAGRINGIGNENAFFGSNAGNNNTSGSDNAFFGRNAGVGNLSGIGNTIIGSNATMLSGGLINAAAIGFKAVVGQSNSLVLGGITGINGGTDTNVGIGTTTPGQRLHVVGNGLFTGNLTVNGALEATLPAGSANYIQNFSGLGSQPSSNFSISGMGKANILDASHYRLAGLSFIGGSIFENSFVVGFGTGTSGSNNLYVGNGAGSNNSGNENSYFGIGSGSLNAVGNGNSFFGMSSNSSAGVSNSTAIGHRSFVGQSNSLVLGSISGVNGATSNTSVGIGTSMPEKELHIRGPGAQEIMIESSDVGGVKWSLQSSGGGSGGRFEIVDRTAVDNRFTILSDGNVGIGTTTPTSLLTVGSPEPTVATGRVGIFGPSGLNLVIRETTNDVEGLIGVNSGSGVFVGSMTSHNLQFRTNNTTRMAISSTGLVSITSLGVADTTTTLCRNSLGQIATCNSSSLRYKTEISPFTGGLDIVKRLRPISFTWNQGRSRDVGFGAEEVAEIDPRLTFTNEKGEVEGVKYDRIGVVLVNAVHEQQAQIEQQKTENRKLRSEMSDLKLYICGKDPTAPFCRAN